VHAEKTTADRQTKQAVAKPMVVNGRVILGISRSYCARGGDNFKRRVRNIVKTWQLRKSPDIQRPVSFYPLLARRTRSVLLSFDCEKAGHYKELVILIWVVNGDSKQPEAWFCFQAISGTYSASNIKDDLFSIRPED